MSFRRTIVRRNLYVGRLEKCDVEIPHFVRNDIFPGKAGRAVLIKGKTMLKTIAVLDHPKVPATGEVAAQIEAALRAMNVQVLRANTWDTEILQSIIGKLELIIVLGGDGSTLRAARLAAPHKVPVTSVNMGKLGFLAEMKPDNWREVLPTIVKGDYWIEERMMLRATAYRGTTVLHAGLSGFNDALNDIVISRGTLARIVRLETRIGETHGPVAEPAKLTTYACDGLIIATPTGSTAYALAAGGPILPPALKNIVLVPIAPHLSLDKPVVLSQGSVVEIIVHTDHQAILTADGQNEVVLQDMERVVVQAGPHVAQFARVQPPTYFYRTLMGRLRMSD